MAEVLLRLVDKGPNADDSKSGDVIAVCPDGWPWSEIELNHPEWAIVTLKCPLAMLSSMLNPLIDGNRVLHAKRERYFDVTGLKPGRNGVVRLAPKTRQLSDQVGL